MLELNSTISCEPLLSKSGGEGVGDTRDSNDTFVRDAMEGGVAPVTLIAGSMERLPEIVAFHCSLVKGETVSIAFKAPLGLARLSLALGSEEMDPEAFLESDACARALAIDVGWPRDRLEKGLSFSAIGEGGMLLFPAIDASNLEDEYCE